VEQGRRIVKKNNIYLIDDQL